MLPPVKSFQNSHTQFYHRMHKQMKYLPVFPSNCYHMRLFAGQKPLQIFNILGLRMTDTISSSLQRYCMFNDMLYLLVSQKKCHVLWLHLLLSLILSKSIPPLHEVRQTQEINHLSFPIDQSTEHGCISMKVTVCKLEYTVTYVYYLDLQSSDLDTEC